MKQSGNTLNNRAAFLVLAVLLFLPLLALHVQAAATDQYLRFNNDKHLTLCENFSISGSVMGSGIALNESCTVYVLNSTGAIINSSNATAASGNFNTTLRSTCYEDNLTITVWCPSVGNASQRSSGEVLASVSAEFINTLPPFGPGDTITLKATPKYSNTTGIANHVVRARIYQANGKNVSWGYAENRSNAQNYTILSFAIPATAEAGDYLVDFGPNLISFSIKNFSISLLTESATSYDSKIYFSPTENISIRVKVRDKNGTALSGATVTTTVVFPNGTDAQSITLTETDTGVFNSTFTRTGGIQGVYTVRASATIGSTTERTSGSFTVKGIRMSISESSFGSFFDDWGSKKVVSPGSNISFDIKAFDVGTGAFVGGGAPPASNKAQMNCSAAYLNSVTSASTGLAVSNVEVQQRLASQPFFGDTMCTVVINTTSTAGTYRVSVNITVNSSGSFVNETAIGYFTTQSFLLSVEPVSKMGREEAFVLVKPGKNASFKLRARNVTSASTMGTGNISSVVVNSLTPLGDFVSAGGRTITNVTYSFDNTTDRLTVFIPTDASGPTLIALQGVVNGQTVVGSGFVIAAYFMGFAGPQGGGMSAGGGMGPMSIGESSVNLEPAFGEVGGGPQGEFSGSFATCAAGQNMNFFAFVMDAETGQAKSDVTLKIYKVREERSGQDLTSCFSTTGGSTDSTGRALFNVSVVNQSCASSLSGFYFMLLDARWQNVTGQLPGGFECKQLNFFPFPANWNLGTSSEVSLSIGNVQHMTNRSRFMTNGTIQIVKMFNFDPEKGMTTIDLSQSNFSSASNWPRVGSMQVTLNMTPANFSAMNSSNSGKWYAGMYGSEIRLCDNMNNSNSSDDVCDTAFSGWKITPFEAYITDNNIWSASWAVNDTKQITFYSKNNITTAAVSRFTFRGNERVRITTFASCANQTIRDVNGLNTTYCNSSTTNQFGGTGFQIIINFTVPVNTTSDMGMFVFTLTNGTESVTQDVFADLKGAMSSVVLPERIGSNEQRIAQSASAYPFDMGGSGGNLSLNTTINVSGANHDILTWNLTYINATYNAISRVTFGPPGYSTAYCAFSDPFNRSVQLLVVPNGTSMEDTTNMLIFIKLNGTTGNGNNVTGPIRLYTNLTTTKSSSRHYLVEYRFCEPVFISSSQSDYTSAGLQNSWSTQWGFAGRYQKNTVGVMPLFFGDASARGQKGAVIDVDSIAAMNFDRIGFGDMMPRSSYVSQQATTDDNGIALVRINFSQAGMFKVFWNATIGGQTDAATFETSPVAESLSFETYAQLSGMNQGGGFSASINTTSEGTSRNLTVQVYSFYFNHTGLANVNLTPTYMQFTDFGPPTIRYFTLNNATTGAVLPNVTTDSSGSVTFNITPNSGWPTGPFGRCSMLEGDANASANYGSARFYVGSVCTVPTG